MPLYEFLCFRCCIRKEELRKIGDYSGLQCEVCRADMDHIVSVPQMLPWNAERKFANLSPKGDGTMTFKSRKHYEQHLKRENLGELGVRAKIKRPHGRKIVKVI